MARGHKSSRSEDRPFIEEPEDSRPAPSATRRPRVYKRHVINEDAGFVHNNSAEYSQAYGQPVPPQYPTRSAPWPPVPPQPMPAPAACYVGNWPQGYPPAQFHGQQIPAQHPAVHPHDGFQYASFPYRGPPQGGFASAQPACVPQTFQQPPFSPHFYRTDGWPEIRPGQGGSATQHSEYRRGHFEYQADSDFNLPTEPRRRRRGHHAPRPAQDRTNEPRPSYDDGCAGGTRRHPRGSSKPENRSPQAPETRPPQARQATLEDAEKHEIPSDYNLQSWDPDEEPIILLGSVFDANSLGKWIYDWTFHTYSHPTTKTETAGELWLLIILLTGKLRQSAKFLSESVGIESIKQDDKDMVDDFIQSGERLKEKFKNLVKECEDSMLIRPGNKGAGRLRSDAGVAFAKAFFGSEDHFAATKKLIKSIILWDCRWEANCAEVLAAKPDTEQPIDDAVDGDRDTVQ